MKKYNLIVIVTLLVFGIFISTSFLSCNKESKTTTTTTIIDSCTNVTCYNGGVCIDGTCNCTTGWEGIDCNINSRTKFVKTWNANDTSSNSVTYNYSSKITTGNTTHSVFIENFANSISISGTPVILNANVIADKITIPSQNIGTAYLVSGIGTFNANNQIDWTYEITSQNGTLYYIGKWN